MSYAAIFTFEIDQGATFKASVTLTNANDGTPYDLSGFTSRFVIKAQEDSEPTVYPSVVVGNTVELSVNSTQTTQLGFPGTIRVLSYEVFVMSPSGDVIKVLKGLFNIRGSF